MENQEVPKKKFYKKWWFWVIIVLVLATIGSGGDTSKQITDSTGETTTAAPEKPREAIVVTAAKLHADYKANEVAADQKYKGNLVRMSGTVGTIGKDVLDTPYVTLTFDQYGFENVQCMFSSKDSAALAALSKGDRVTLEGEVSGKSITNVLVRDCRLVK